MEKEPAFLNRIEDLYIQANELKERYENLDDLVLAIGAYIRERTMGYAKPESLLESRLTTAKDAFEKRLFSCGTMVTMAAEMLRHIGYSVRLVHGECDESVDHAWFKVLDPDSGDWRTYDLTRKDGVLPESSVAKIETDSWEDIEEQLIIDDDTGLEREMQRSILKNVESND